MREFGELGRRVCSACSRQENKQLLGNYDKWLRQLVDTAEDSSYLRIAPSSVGSLLPPPHLRSSTSELLDQLSSRSRSYSTSLADSPLTGASDRWRDLLA
eukprot:1184971-Prorocentrum_minimum.AAC.1